MSEKSIEPRGPGDEREIETLEHLRGRLEAESSEGLKLLESLQDNPICSVDVDESVPCITVVWKRYATSTQLRYIHENIIQLLEQNRLDRILGDDTGLPTIHADDQRWIVEDWMLRAKAAGLKAGASKKPSSYFGNIAIDSIRSVAPSGLVMRSFDEIEDARRWLRDFGR